MSQRKAVVLLSGGLDSTTVLAIAKSQGYEPYALSFRYGQRHVVELEAAKRVAQAQGVAQHVVCDIDLRTFGGSALTSETDVPKHDSAEELSAEEIPVTYVLYPDEGHGFQRPENRMSFYAVSEAFLSEHLGGKYEPFNNDLKGSSMKVPEGGQHIPGLSDAAPSSK